MPGQCVYLCFEDRPGWDLLAACSQFGDVKVCYLLTSLSRRGLVSGCASGIHGSCWSVSFSATDTRPAAGRLPPAADEPALFAGVRCSGRLVRRLAGASR
jgi:hypothetical protein